MAGPTIPSLPDWRHNRMARGQVKNFYNVLRIIALGRLPDDQILSRNALLSRLLVALALATVLWVYITEQENPVQRKEYTLPIVVKNLPKDLAVRSGGLTPVKVTLQGLQGSFKSSQQLSPFVDLGQLTSDVREAQVPVMLEGRQSNVDYTITPATLTLLLERQVRRSIPVSINAQGALPFGLYEPSQPQINPAVVTVSGPEDRVNQVQSVTVAVPLVQVAGSTTLTLVPQLLDKQGNPIQDPSLSIGKTQTVAVTIKVEQVYQTRTVPIAPITLGSPASGYLLGPLQPQPATVTVVGPPQVINTLAAVTTEPINLQGLTKDTVRTTHLTLSPGVSVLAPSSKGVLESAPEGPVWKVLVPVSLVPTDLTLHAYLTGYDHLSKNLQAHTVVRWVDVTVRGSYDAVRALGPAHSRLNLQGLGPGIYNIKPTLDLPHGVSIVSINPTTVQVVVTANPKP